MNKAWSLYCIYWKPLRARGSGDPPPGGALPHVVKRDGSISKRRPGLLTYVGITNDPARRLRQHNGEIAGGAKYTTRTKGGVWKFLYIVSGFPNSSSAGQWEWRLHRRGKRLNRSCVVCNRLAALRQTAQMEKVTARAPPNASLVLSYTFPNGEPAGPIPPKGCVCFLSDAQYQSAAGS